MVEKTETLAEQLAAAESTALRLRREIGGATCAEIGEHDWQFTGGTNAGCCPRCICSVPVHECKRCGDCDYGVNADAEDARAECIKGCREDDLNAIDPSSPTFDAALYPDPEGEREPESYGEDA